MDVVVSLSTLASQANITTIYFINLKYIYISVSSMLSSWVASLKVSFFCSIKTYSPFFVSEP